MKTITVGIKASCLAIVLLSLAAPVFAATVLVTPCGPLAVAESPELITTTCYANRASVSASAEVGGYPSEPGIVFPAESTVYGFVEASTGADLANTMGTETITFQTAGPLRPGIADLYTYGQAIATGNSAGAGDGAGVFPFESSPVELGTTLSISGFASVSTGGPDDSENAQAFESFWYVIYEADGVTPVTVLDVAATPEPSTLALTLPLAVLCVVSLRRRTAICRRYRAEMLDS